MRLQKIIRRVLKEEYNKKRLYPVEFIYNETARAPLEIRQIVKNLVPIDCVNEKGDRRSCFRIPEVLYVYITGRY